MYQERVGVSSLWESNLTAFAVLKLSILNVKDSTPSPNLLIIPTLASEVKATDSKQVSQT